jgi:hypothetical protein
MLIASPCPSSQSKAASKSQANLNKKLPNPPLLSQSQPHLVHLPLDRTITQPLEFQKRLAVAW